MDARDFDKEEFTTLRAESQFHQVNASAVFALHLTALGLGVATSSNQSVTLPLVALLSSVLWLRYLDHVVSIFRVAAYLTCWLRPRLCRKLEDRQLLVWEEFLRSSDRDEADRAEDAAGRIPLSRTRGLPRTRLADHRKGVDVASVAFAAPPPLLLFIYAVSIAATVPLPTKVGMICLVGLAALVWLYALRRAWRTRGWIQQIDARIKETVNEVPVLRRADPS